ncbi:MAG: ATP-binding protein [Litorimonas sp.]
MNGFLLVLSAALPSFLLGYALRRFTLKWQAKADTAKLEADIQAEQLAATVSASLDGIIIINSDGCIVEFSESAERIFGFKKDDILGKNMASLIVPERYQDAHNAGMARMRETGKANILGQRIEIEAVRANGEEFMSELAISRSRSSSGDIFIAYIRDISKAKAAEKALLDAKEAAELANRAKTQFISAMSHEIRTPFNAVLGILDILGDTELTKDQKQLIQTAERTSKSLLRIINDVLDYARISSGSVKVRSEPFFAADVFDDVYRLFAMQAKDQGIDFIIKVEDAAKKYLAGDVGRIRQILMNFVSNAIKYTDEGHVELIVDVRLTADEKWELMCRVKDTGAGIKSDKLEHLFDEFYMVDDVDTRATEGTGLGLTICKVLVTMMDGEIGVESDFGKGSDFWIKIPLAEANAPEKTEKARTPMADISGKKILLAEDNATNRMVVTRILKKRGAVIIEAKNGVEALPILDSQEIDLLLTDIFMPEMGGKELVRLLRNGNSPNVGVPVIALTAMGDMHEAEELKTYGVDQVVLKPFNARDLVNAIAEQCQRHDHKPQNLETDTDKDETVNMKLSGGLLDGLDAEDLLEIKGQFKMDLSNVTESLRNAVDQSDIEAAKFSSHTLKGLAGLYGLTELSEEAALTNSHCFADTHVKMVEHGSRAIKLAEQTLLSLDDLFGKDKEAA